MKKVIATKIIELKGIKPGPTSIILVGVHGNETCGVRAMDIILPKLKIKSGKVFISYANPRAIQAGTRYTETNLNRMFISESKLTNDEKNSYEFKRAQYLKIYLGKADALLDVHSSNNPESTPFLICEGNAKRITDYLPIQKVVSGFDKVEPGGTDYFMNKKGKIGICVECGYSRDPKSVKIAAETIYNFLIIQGHLDGKLQKTNKTYIQMYSLYKSKTNNFRLKKSFKDFEKISKQRIIGLDNKNRVKAKKHSVILFAKDSNKKGQEVFLLGEIKKPRLKKSRGDNQTR